MPTISNLDELADALRNAPETKNTTEQAEYAAALGLPVANGEIDLANLPTFGGEEPTDTHGIWSWDAERLLVTYDPCPWLPFGDALYVGPRLALVSRSEFAELRAAAEEC